MNHETPSRPVFLLGAHKSGTSLLRSLLDGHPELFVLPFETHFLQLANYWVDYRLRRAQPPLRSIAETKQAYTQLIEHYNTVADPTADASLTGQFDLDRFRRELDLPAADMSGLFQVYACAVYASLTGEALPAAARVVEKSTENAELALDLKQFFPAARDDRPPRNRVRPRRLPL